MQVKTWAMTLGIGAAAGAVAVLMLPRQNPARRIANQAACRVEDAAERLSDQIFD